MKALLLALSLLASLTFSTPAQTTHTFTNTQGNQLEAELLRVEGDKVIVRRIADNREFTLSLASLIPEDRTWIAGAVSKLPPPPGSWSTVLIHFPFPRLESFGVIGMDRSVPANFEFTDAIPHGAGRYEFLLPVGAWFSFRVDNGEAPKAWPEFLVRYGGEKTLELSLEGNTLLVSRDGAAPRIAGIRFPEKADPAAILAALDKSRLAESVCVNVYRDFPAELRTFKDTRIDAVTANLLWGDALARVAEMRPRALQAEVWGTEGLDRFSPLEALFLRDGATSREENGVPVQPDTKSLGDLPAVRDLTIVNFGFDANLALALDKNPGLRLFTHIPDSEKKLAIEWKNIDKHIQLEGLALAEAFTADPNKIASLPRLRSLSIIRRTLTGEDSDLDALTEMKGLLALSTDHFFPAETITAWINKTNLAELRRLDLRNPAEIRHLTKLEALSITDVLADDPAFLQQLESIPGLRYFKTSLITPAHLDDFGRLPCTENITSLKINLKDGSADDTGAIATLAALPKLTYLRLSGDSFGTRPGTLAIPTIDLAAFPALTDFEARNIDTLETLTGIDHHPTLARLVVKYSKALANPVTAPLPNPTLCEVTWEPRP